MDEKQQIGEEIVRFARLALSGRPQDIQAYIRRLAHRYQELSPEVAVKLNSLLQESPTRQLPLRGEFVSPVPVDLETRLQLLRVESSPNLEVEPIWSTSVGNTLEQVLSERRSFKKLS